jgi:hypothetical protein
VLVDAAKQPAAIPARIAHRGEFIKGGEHVAWPKSRLALISARQQAFGRQRTDHLSFERELAGHGTGMGILPNPF